jgi:hypothetical protein
LNGRLAKVEALLAADAPHEAQARRALAAWVAFWEIVPDDHDLPERVAGVLGDAASWDHPLRQWLRDLTWGLSTVPPDLAPDVARRLLEICLDAPESVEHFAVCNDCGLSRPRRRLPPLREWKLLPGKLAHVGAAPWWDLPADFFEGCPHCHNAAWTYAHLCGPRWLAEEPEH